MLTPEQRRNIRELNLDLKLEYLELAIRDIIERSITQVLAQREQESKERSPLLTIEEIAQKFKVTKATIHNWKNRGLITGSKVGKNRYFTEDEVRKALAAYRYPQAG